MNRATKLLGVLLAAAAIAGACDKVPLLAPTDSTITVTAPTQLLPTNGSTQITAVVLEEAGTAVHNGTTVRFTTSLGRVDPVEVQTRNGIAITTFFAGNNSGVAEIRANSGAATGTETGSGDTAGTSNVVRITVGSAAVKAVSVRANPASISPNGSTVELIASVVATDGSALPGVLVTFSADQGTLSSSTALTSASGEARTTLTSSQSTTVNATAGLITSSNVTIPARAAPAVTLACLPAGTSSSCAALQPTANNTATVSFSITRATTSSALRSATIDFGDGSSQNLGNLAGGATTVVHTYAGSEDGNPRAYTATVNVVDANGEAASASTSLSIAPRTRTPINVNLEGTCGTANAQGQRCTFTATATGGGEGGVGNASIESYTWNFGDATNEVATSGNTTAHIYTTNGRYTVTVTARTADGRTSVGRTEIIVSGIP